MPSAIGDDGIDPQTGLPEPSPNVPTPRERFVELAAGAVGLGVGPGRNRERYLDLVSRYVPDYLAHLSHEGRTEYATISACGLLVRGLLLEAGLRHPLLDPLPAPEPEGAGVAMLRALAADAGALLEPQARGPGPCASLGRSVLCSPSCNGARPGDLIFSDPKKPHVAVVLPPPPNARPTGPETVRLWTLDGGQREGHPLGPQWAQRTYRAWTFDHERHCWRSIGGELIGWVDFDALAAACGVTS